MRIWILAATILGTATFFSVPQTEAGQRGVKSYSNGTGLNARVRRGRRARGPQVRGFISGVGGYSYQYGDTLNFDFQPELDATPSTGPNPFIDSNSSADSMFWGQ